MAGEKTYGEHENFLIEPTEEIEETIEGYLDFRRKLYDPSMGNFDIPIVLCGSVKGVLRVIKPNNN